jgi:hypothetical protein
MRQGKQRPAGVEQPAPVGSPPTALRGWTGHLFAHQPTARGVLSWVGVRAHQTFRLRRGPTWASQEPKRFHRPLDRFSPKANLGSLMRSWALQGVACRGSPGLGGAGAWAGMCVALPPVDRRASSLAERHGNARDGYAKGSFRKHSPATVSGGLLKRERFLHPGWRGAPRRRRPHGWCPMRGIRPAAMREAGFAGRVANSIDGTEARSPQLGNLDANSSVVPLGSSAERGRLSTTQMSSSGIESD